MVSNATMISMGIEIVLSVGVPLIAVVYLMVKRKITWKPVAVGAFVFMVSQIFLRLPLLQQLSQYGWYQAGMSNVVVSAIFLGLTAGLFEEVGRYVGFKRMPKRRRFWDGVAFGLGHGGIESILIVGVSTINNLMVSSAINNGSVYTMFASADKGLVDEMVTILTTTPSWLFVMGGVERLCTLAIHIALSLFVLRAIRRNDKMQVVQAILLHTLVNTPIAFLAPLGILVTELYVIACAVVSVMFILKMSREMIGTADSDSIEMNKVVQKK